MKHSRKKYNKGVSAKDFFANNGVAVERYQNFAVRLEVLLAKALNRCEYIMDGVRRYWQKAFPEIEGNAELYDLIEVYVVTHRRMLLDIIKGADIANEEYKYILNVERILIRYKFLLEARKKEFRLKDVCGCLWDELSEVINNRKLIEETIEICVNEYFGKDEKYCLAEEMAKNNLYIEWEEVEQISIKIRNLLKVRIDKANPHSILEAKFNIIKIEDILEISFLDWTEDSCSSEKRHFEKLVKKHWGVSFDEKKLTPKVENDLLRIISEDEFLNSLKILIIAGSLKNIQKPFYARVIAYGYTLKYVLTRIGSCRDLDTIIDETIKMASRMNFIGVNKEEENNIIEKLVNRYCTSNGEIDEEIIQHLLKRKEIIEKMYSVVKESFNSRYSSKAIEEKDRIIHELQKRVEIEDMNTLKKLTEHLTDANRGYILNNLYRFCYGYDEFPISVIKDNLLGLFYTLNQLGITPTYEDKINQSFTDEDVLSDICKFDGEATMEEMEYRVHFPGWKVNGNLVVAPVSVVNEKE
uniref:hypothetical protein n=1 Tax=Agathobacter sp. TaxID=2021311 RepID=UPI00405774AE